MVDVRRITPTAIGGVPIEGQPELDVAAGDGIHLVVLHLPVGFVHPMHNHPDNESMGYVVSGRLEMVVGDKTYELGAGGVWHHPRGACHSTRAIESTVAVEVHAPLRTDLMGDDSSVAWSR